MAETVYKAKKPFKQDGKHYYPITTHDQIIMPDGNRWDGQHLSSDVRDEATEVGSIKVNADLLGGKLPEYYKNATTLGGVAAEKYALKTDTAPDSSKLGGKAPEYYIQPRNLLDNSDFSNLIVQSGLNGAHGRTAYIADRWISTDASATQQNGYTALSTTAKSGRISQKLPDALAGKTVTAAAKVSGNSIVYCGIYYIQNSVSKSIAVHVSAPNGIIMKSGTIPSDATDVEFRIYIAYTDGGGSCNVYWAALYEGAYTADTLPPYVPKGYAAELAECQRYYLPVSDYWNMGVVLTGTGYICLNIPTNIKMRITPNVIISGAKAYHPTYDWFDLTYRTIEWHSPFYRIIFNWPSSIQASISDIVLINGVTGLSADL